MNIAEEFFGGVEALRNMFARALARARKEQGMTTLELDAICGFGANGFPSSNAYESNPALLTSTIISRATFPLELAVDSVLEVNWVENDPRLDAVLKLMEDEGAGIAAKAGGASDSNVALSDQARVYVIVRALEELDAPVAQTAGVNA